MFELFISWIQDFFFPAKVGMPIGEPEDDATYIMEVHYNNPDLRDGELNQQLTKIPFSLTSYMVSSTWYVRSIFQGNIKMHAIAKHGKYGFHL